VDRVLTLVADAREVSALGDTDLALQLLLGAAVRCWWAALDTAVRRAVLAAAEELPVAPLEPRRLAVIGCVAPLERGAEIVARAPRAIAEAGDNPQARWFLAIAAHAVNEHELSLAILSELVPLLRRNGSFGLLAQALSMAQWDAAMVGDWATAEATASEGDRLARDTGQRIWGAGITCGLSAAAAVRGDAERADELATAAERVIVPHGLADMHSVLLAARGIAAVAAGRHDDAFAVLWRAFDPEDRAYHYRERFGALGYLAEAALESGTGDDARVVVDELAEVATAASAPGLRASVAFAQALLTRGEEQAIAAARGAFMRARLQLAYGRRLAREGRREEARRELARACAGFAEAGAPPWREQAENALRRAA
jgi:tetratricopeptide (TPR) repeat protein